jgi:RNA polymerase sigma-70 factor (ECF subfamily)
MNADLKKECLKHRKRLFNYFYKMTGNDYELSQDLTQQTFLKIFVYFDKHSITEKDYLPTWCLKVGKNIYIDYLRKKKDILECDLDDFKEKTFSFSDNLISEENIENYFLKKDLRERLKMVFDTLSPRDKEALLVLQLNVLDEIQYHKISKIVNRSNDSLRQDSCRIKKILRNKLSGVLQI